MMNFPKFLNILSPRYLCNYSKMVKKKKKSISTSRTWGYSNTVLQPIGKLSLNLD